jgi:hypothetical protein
MWYRMTGCLINWKGFGWKGSWPNFRYYSGICLAGQRKTYFCQDSWRSGRDSDQVTPAYKPEVFPLGPSRSVVRFCCLCWCPISIRKLCAPVKKWRVCVLSLYRCSYLSLFESTFDVKLRLSPCWVRGNIGSTDATKTCHNLNSYIFETNNLKKINNTRLDSS